MILHSSLHSLRCLGFPGYYIDQYGIVLSNRFRRIHELSTRIDRCGYVRVGLFNTFGILKQVLVHRLVATIFIPTTDYSLQVDHIDGCKINNRLTNLRWVTNRENAHAAMQNGLMPHAVFKSNDVVEEICKRISNGESTVSISRDTGFSAHAIAAIKLRRNWTHISSKYMFPVNTSPKHVDINTIKEMCRLIIQGVPDREIKQLLGLRKETIFRTRMGRIYKEIYKEVFEEFTVDHN